MQNLLLSYLGLLALLALTVCMSMVGLGQLGVVVSLIIAACKTTLITWFFMGLRSADAQHRLVAASGLVWLTILLSLSLSDYLFRVAD